VAGYPFQPVAEWLRHFLAHASPANVGMVRARHGAQLSRLVPELVGAYSAADQAQLAAVGGDPFALYEAVVGWLTLVSDGGPILLVLDDLQWASRPTLAMLQHLVATATPVSRACCSPHAATTTCPNIVSRGSSDGSTPRDPCNASPSEVSNPKTS
jgi:hypothetical protein